MEEDIAIILLSLSDWDLSPFVIMGACSFFQFAPFKFT